MQSDLLLRKVLEEIFLNSHLKVLRIPDSHAGGKWRLKYSSVLGGQGSLEVDLNFLQRVPLWQTQKSNSVSVGGKSVQSVRVMNVCELFAGKMAALFSRSAARDFFDVHHLCTNFTIDTKNLRFACIIYGAMSLKDWRSIPISGIVVDSTEVRSRSFPYSRKITLFALIGRK